MLPVSLLFLAVGCADGRYLSQTLSRPAALGRRGRRSGARWTPCASRQGEERKREREREDVAPPPKPDFVKPALGPHREKEREREREREGAGEGGKERKRQRCAVAL